MDNLQNPYLSAPSVPRRAGGYPGSPLDLKKVSEGGAAKSPEKVPDRIRPRSGSQTELSAMSKAGPLAASYSSHSIPSFRQWHARDVELSELPMNNKSTTRRFDEQSVTVCPTSVATRLTTREPLAGGSVTSLRTSTGFVTGGTSSAHFAFLAVLPLPLAFAWVVGL